VLDMLDMTLLSIRDAVFASRQTLPVRILIAPLCFFPLSVLSLTEL
jgi:hypothetical protein